MSNFSQEGIIEVNSFQDIPNFPNEEEEADFWNNHGLGDNILDKIESWDDFVIEELLTYWG